MNIPRLSCALLAFVTAAAPAANAFEIRPFDKRAAQSAISAGRPVVLHVYAPWCLQCNIQEKILDGLKSDPAYTAITVYRVNYDNQKDEVRALNSPRATLIGYRRGREVARMSWGITEDVVVNVLKATR